MIRSQACGATESDEKGTEPQHDRTNTGISKLEKTDWDPNGYKMSGDKCLASSDKHFSFDKESSFKLNSIHVEAATTNTY